MQKRFAKRNSNKIHDGIGKVLRTYEPSSRDCSHALSSSFDRGVTILMYGFILYCGRRLYIQVHAQIKTSPWKYKRDLYLPTLTT
jgi:hypothetical protein